MEIKQFIINIIATIWIYTITDVSGQCTFPVSISGDWKSSILGDISFNSTYLDGIIVSNFGKHQFECLEQNETKYLVRSEAFEFATVAFRAYICFDIRPINENKVVYYRIAEEDPAMNHERILLRSASTVVTMEQVCNEVEPYNPEFYSLLVRTGAIEQNAVIKCPDIIRGDYNAVYTDTSGLSDCPDGAILDVCDNNKQLSFNFGSCGKSHALQEKLDCLYTKEENNVTYITAYSQQNTKFVCLAASENDTTVYLSQHDNDCSPGQNGTNVDSTGRLMEIVLSINGTGHCKDVITTTTTISTTISQTGETSGSTVKPGNGSGAGMNPFQWVFTVTMTTLFAIFCI